VTLRWRLALALAAAVAIGAVVFGVAARATVEHVLYDDVDQQLRGEVRRVVGDVGGRDDRGGMDEQPVPRGPFGTSRSGRPGVFGGRGPGAVFGREAPFAQVLDADGDIVLRTTAVESIGGFPDPEVDSDSPGDLRERTIGIDGDRYRLVEAAGRDGVVVQVARPLDEVAGFLDTLMWVLAAAGAVALGAALLLGPWVARATLRPVERMTATARTIAGSPRDLTQRVEPAFPDPELREFADAMNEMLESIDSADRHQRRFVADASHELRTPLTSLGGNAAYLERTAELDEDAGEALGAVRRDVERLTRIADGLTMLARLDATPVSQAEPCDLGALAFDAVERFRRLYPDHGFELGGATGVHLLDVELARRIVDNLVDNAGRYTPAGSTVRVTVGIDGDAVTLDVVDDGSGLAEHERAHVLERFHRGTTSAGASGTGLGLAIVDEAARALGGSLELRDAAPRGLHAHVRVRSTAPARG
jgi:two-component system OmpR family sensor kinase